ncbi:hypothetical protein [Clostridium rectalis]|uniref:hypothetical protein n=1 Tax=Clostridium rectalis TaxID=2040295 RepID=UPI000F63F4B6|nr:hypothetical protein [Clostridium rectalis]
MGNMYKETVTRRKLPSLVKFFAILVCTLFFLEIIETLPISKEYIGKVIMGLCSILVLVALIFEVFRCRVKYTYSLIADQFIIHRIKGEEDKVVENIKVRNIEYIGKKDLSKFRSNISSSKRYICSVLNFKPYCCVYKDGNKLRKFYFEPSNNLIEKIKFHRKKRLANF